MVNDLPSNVDESYETWNGLQVLVLFVLCCLYGNVQIELHVDKQASTLRSILSATKLNLCLFFCDYHFFKFPNQFMHTKVL